MQVTTMPDPEYMSMQNEVTWKMRGILVDWLVEIHTKFRLLPETIFLAVNIIDRFLSVRVVSIVKFQLVGVTALFIAAKYEEVVCPSVQNFLYMTDGGYTDEEILKAERYILGIIGFNLSYPNPINFLRRVSKADGYDIHSRTMAKYLMEISIVDHRFMSTTPSLIAAAATWLARKVLGSGAWVGFFSPLLSRELSSEPNRSDNVLGRIAGPEPRALLWLLGAGAETDRPTDARLHCPHFAVPHPLGYGRHRGR